MENILEIKKLNLFFDKYQALYNVDLTLKKGVMETKIKGSSEKAAIAINNCITGFISFKILSINISQSHY